MTGTVVSGANNTFVVLSDDGLRIHCCLKGKKLKGAEGFYTPLAAGDRVNYTHASEGRGRIDALIPRASLFWRYNEKGRAVQPIAANMDTVVCVTSCAMPPFRPRFIDRVSLLPVSQGLRFIVVLNKTDLGCGPEIETRLRFYRAAGFETLFVSVRTEEGIAKLQTLICGHTNVFVGQSGVGKSSLLNALEPGLKLKVDAVCEKYERGRHTTVAGALYISSDGATRFIDTPGFRRFAVRGLDPFELSSCFPEFAEHAERCPLGARCRHIDEPDCAVAEAAEQGRIHPDRYESYARISDELRVTKDYEKKRGRPQPKDDDYDYE